MILDLSLELEDVGFWLLAHIYYPIKKNFAGSVQASSFLEAALLQALCFLTLPLVQCQ